MKNPVTVDYLRSKVLFLIDNDDIAIMDYFDAEPNVDTEQCEFYNNYLLMMLDQALENLGEVGRREAGRQIEYAGLKSQIKECMTLN